MSLIIRKRVSLAFLGDEYKEACLTFKAIPLKDFSALQDDITAIGEDNKKSIEFISEKLKEYFVTGQAPDENGKSQEVKVEDLGDLDQESVIKCFSVLTGQSINEESDFLDKASSKPSTTEPSGLTN